MRDTISRFPGPGIPHELAIRRAAIVCGLRYTLRLRVPDDPLCPVTGSVRIELELAADADWPAIDFAPYSDDVACAEAIRSLRVNGRAAHFAMHNGHIIIDAVVAKTQRQIVEIGFEAGAGGLRRRPDLVYTLFVPALAHTVFPCLDQPDLKASLSLELEIPQHWETIGNAPETTRHDDGERLRISFAATERLPTYLYAFAAGRLQHRSCQHADRTLELLSPAAAESQVDQNLDELVRLHVASLDYMERYSAINYPFVQLGAVLIPDFEFGGMEHPGATFFRQELLLLQPENNEVALQLRAGLIAHELAHMWFGNLVTMRWFNDVWLKEVFANFMADRILALSFPDTDHDLGFMLRHFHQANDIDRTEGTHAILQPLANLADAGELYDALIYHKAPIAMAELEQHMGEQSMQEGLRGYLAAFSFANADWTDLHQHLQRRTKVDLTDFSRRWLEQPGRGQLACHYDADGPPRYRALLHDNPDRERALDTFARTAAPTKRAAAWLALYEDMLDGGIEPARLLTALLNVLEHETNDLLLARLLEDLHEIYWRFLSESRRGIAAGPVERVLNLRLQSDDKPTYWLTMLARFAATPESVAELVSVWQNGRTAAGTLNESAATRLAIAIALRRPEQAHTLLAEQIARTRDADRRGQLEFLCPALSPERAERDRLFEQLLAGQGRKRWAVAALELLNHPLRSSDAMHYLVPGMCHAAELRGCSEIFLPRQWLTALFNGHDSVEAASMIRDYLQAETRQERLRQLILQTADPVFRCARWACR